MPVIEVRRKLGVRREVFTYGWMPFDDVDFEEAEEELEKFRVRFPNMEWRIQDVAQAQA